MLQGFVRSKVLLQLSFSKQQENNRCAHQRKTKEKQHFCIGFVKIITPVWLMGLPYLFTVRKTIVMLENMGKK